MGKSGQMCGKQELRGGVKEFIVLQLLVISSIHTILYTASKIQAAVGKDGTWVQSLQTHSLSVKEKRKSSSVFQTLISSCVTSVQQQPILP